MKYTERELNIAMGKLLVGHGKIEDAKIVLDYTTTLEILVKEASDEDFFGTEGWKHRIGWDE